jgi:Serine dehydrogenase proteinase
MKTPNRAYWMHEALKQNPERREPGCRFDGEACNGRGTPVTRRCDHHLSIFGDNRKAGWYKGRQSAGRGSDCKAAKRNSTERRAGSMANWKEIAAYLNMEDAKPAPEGFVKIPERKQILSSVLEEHDLAAAQRAKRKELLEALEKKAPEGTKCAYVSFFCSDVASLDSGDVPAIGDILASVGDVDELNLIISGPGGDGTIAEKVIELCRAYCKTFRVIVPNRAKSAATLIALGADEIVMGFSSELGPIDAQVPVIVGGFPRYISAQSFIDSRDSLMDKYAKAVKKKEDPKAILQQIAGLDPPFIDHCEKLMDFGRAVASKYLEKYMFAGIKAKAARSKAIANVIDKLSSVEGFKVHGRMIDGNAAKTDLKLNVRLLPKDDPLWQDVWHYYIRADIALVSGVGKIIESRCECLYGRRRPD